MDTLQYKNLDEAKEKYLQLTEAVRNGQDYFDRYGKGFTGWTNSVLTTVNDTEDAAKSFGNVIATNLLNRMDDIANKKGPEAQKAIEDLVDEMDNDEATRSVIAHLDEYIPDEKVRARIENMISHFRRLNDEINNIDPNELARLQIEGIRDPYKKELAIIEQDFKEDLVKHNGFEWVTAANEKRNKRIEDANKRHNDEIAAKNKQAAEEAKQLKEENNRKLLTADKELYNAELTMMEDGLAKQLKTIRKSYEERIRAAKENGAKVNEVVAALNRAMEKELEDAVDKTFDDLSKTASSLIKQVQDIKLENMLDKATMSIDKFNDKLSDLPQAIEGVFFATQKEYDNIQLDKKVMPNIDENLKVYVDRIDDLKTAKKRLYELNYLA